MIFLSLIAFVAFDIVLWGGSCRDAAPDGEGASSCTSGPLVGSAPAALIAFIASALVVLAIVRLVQLRSRE